MGREISELNRDEVTALAESDYAAVPKLRKHGDAWSEAARLARHVQSALETRMSERLGTSDTAAVRSLLKQIGGTGKSAVSLASAADRRATTLGATADEAERLKTAVDRLNGEATEAADSHSADPDIAFQGYNGISDPQDGYQAYLSDVTEDMRSEVRLSSNAYEGQAREHHDAPVNAFAGPGEWTGPMPERMPQPVPLGDNYSGDPNKGPIGGGDAGGYSGGDGSRPVGSVGGATSVSSNFEPELQSGPSPVTTSPGPGGPAPIPSGGGTPSGPLPVPGTGPVPGTTNPARPVTPPVTNRPTPGTTLPGGTRPTPGLPGSGSRPSIPGGTTPGNRPGMPAGQRPGGAVPGSGSASISGRPSAGAPGGPSGAVPGSGSTSASGRPGSGAPGGPTGARPSGSGTAAGGRPVTGATSAGPARPGSTSVGGPATGGRSGAGGSSTAGGNRVGFTSTGAPAGASGPGAGVRSGSVPGSSQSPGGGPASAGTRSGVAGAGGPGGADPGSKATRSLLPNQRGGSATGGVAQSGEATSVRPAAGRGGTGGFTPTRSTVAPVLGGRGTGSASTQPGAVPGGRSAAARPELNRGSLTGLRSGRPASRTGKPRTAGSTAAAGKVIGARSAHGAKSGAATDRDELRLRAETRRRFLNEIDDRKAMAGNDSELLRGIEATVVPGVITSCPRPKQMRRGQIGRVFGARGWED